MNYTWEDQVQEYWDTGALLDGDDALIQDINRHIQTEPGKVLPRVLWLKSRAMPMTERRELDALWVRLMDKSKAEVERAAASPLGSDALQLPQMHPAAPESPPFAPSELKLYELTTNVPYCDGCRDVTWFLGRDGRRQPVAPYDVLLVGHREMLQDPVQCEFVDGPERAVDSFFTEDEARLVEMLMPLNGNLRVTKRHVPLPYSEYHHRFSVVYDSMHILSTLKFHYELPFPISIYYDIDQAEDPIEEGEM